LLQAWFRLKSFRKCFPIYFKKRKMPSSRNQASQGPSRPFCPKRHARGFSSRAAAHTQEALAWPLHSLSLSHARSRPADLFLLLSPTNFIPICLGAGAACLSWRLCLFPLCNTLGSLFPLRIASSLFIVSTRLLLLVAFGLSEATC
jgi:hypothetical protein